MYKRWNRWGNEETVSGTFGSADAFISCMIHNPVQVIGHSGIHSWIVFPGTSFAPRHDACVPKKIYVNIARLRIITIIYIIHTNDFHNIRGIYTSVHRSATITLQKTIIYLLNLLVGTRYLITFSSAWSSKFLQKKKSFIGNVIIKLIRFIYLTGVLLSFPISSAYHVTGDLLWWISHFFAVRVRYDRYVDFLQDVGRFFAFAQPAPSDHGALDTFVWRFSCVWKHLI